MSTTNIDIDDDLHAILQNKDVTLKDAVNGALRESLGVDRLDSIDAVERRIDKTESDLRDAKETLESAQERVNALETELDRLADRRDTLKEEQATLEEELDGVLDMMVEDPRVHVFSYHPDIRSIATQHNLATGEVMQELQLRADGRDVDIGSERFSQKEIVEN